MGWPDTVPRTLYEIISIPLCIVPRSFGVKRSMAILILVNNQLDAQFLMYVYVYSLHVSGSHLPISRRIIVSMRHPVCHSV